MSVLLSVFLAVQAPPAAAPEMIFERPATADTSDRIVVTGARVRDYQQRLAACLARNCPPDEDIAATLALAEVLFLEGDYDESRSALAASLRRNYDEAKAFPEDVADLHHARALIARHVGQDNEALRGTMQVLSALKEGLPVEDYRHFDARLGIADLQAATGNMWQAVDELKDLMKKARDAGRPDIAAVAELRMLWYRYLASPSESEKRELERLASLDDPEQRIQSQGAKILLSKIYRREGDDARADALIAESVRGRVGKRTLLYAPPYELGMKDMQEAGQSVDILNRVSDDHQDTWIDVGFWVLGDGRVGDVEIVREGARSNWARPLLQSIRGRRYTPTPDGSATYRLERYTYMAPVEYRTGSRLAARSPAARLEYFDLTTAADEPPAPTTDQN